MYFNAWIKKRYYFRPQQSGMRQRAECIGAATASSPSGPFHPVAGPPLVCQLNQHGAIDPRSFRSPAGLLYLVWKSDDNAFPGSRPTHIFSQRLSGDGLHLVGQRYLLLSGTPDLWDDGLVEAPDLVFAKGSYWLFFSGSWFNQDSYAIGLARCAGPQGPCHLTSRHPFLGSNDQGKAPGEESLFHNQAGWWIVYSPWSLYAHTYRPVALGKIDFGEEGPYLAKFSRTPVLASTPRHVR
jgi:beta-xylosidase